ncbi:hypothetical protein THRCLA_23451 [Thraustotheca clavata]|uniref:Uncharacterized protein n=1 Tax=Thraustotheca clavata TaxID=74557 RepID=A0A1V9Y4K7_9STRA|nr:hypothetical protein THRCLA_23451 [Thraustotheca clavata]
MAATYGHLNMVKYLIACSSQTCSVKAMDGAAGNGHFHVVKWLHETEVRDVLRMALIGLFSMVISILSSICIHILMMTLIRIYWKMKMYP